MSLVESVEGRRYDLVIIGGGVAGISVALQLADGGRTVLIVESGSDRSDAAIQALASVEAEGDLSAEHFASHSQRVFGGTSNIWGGFCTVLERRSFLTGGWPIDYEELSGYYPAAAEILDLPEESYRDPTQPLCGSAGVVYKPFFQSSTRFGKKYLGSFAAHETIDVLLRHTATRLVHSSRRVRAVSVVPSLGGSAFDIEAGRFVLAAGGLGNPRLLLQSGLGESRAVGRYMMEHPHVSNAGWLELDARCIRPAMEALRSERYHALQISSEECVERGIPSFSVQFHDGAGQANLLGERVETLRSSLFIRAEMRPARTNRFSLLDGDAPTGPKGYVHLRLPARDALLHVWDVLSELLLRGGVGRMSPLKPKLRIGAGGHLLGTTRMGDDARSSVVDADARVHGAGNLYVTGSSVFPHAGAANPTYTIVALAVRLGRHLAAQGEGEWR
ncbi:MAG: GMC oxidoreductase [Myxococcota bacterium]